MAMELTFTFGQLEVRIKEDGVGISETLEKDILKIMGGQCLEATLHMK